MHTSRRLTFDAIMLALLIICSQLSIPLPGVPLTLQTFAVGLLASLLPVTDTLIVIALYIFLGAIGLPVFANYTAGLGVIYSAMGGYIIGFLIEGMLISGILHWRGFGRINIIIANIIGAAVQLLIGSLWLMAFNHVTLLHALMVGFVPFIVPGLIKVYLIYLVAWRLDKVIAFQPRG